MKRRARPGLFDLHVAGECLAYRNVRGADAPMLAATRAHCEELWAEFKEFASPKFIADFARQFHQSWFEMYLTVALRRAGFDAQYNAAGPDVLLNFDDRRVWIEAIAPTGGSPDCADHVPELAERLRGRRLAASAVPRDPIVLRITHAFATKAKRFSEYREKSIVADEDACVIAISLHDVPLAWTDAAEYMQRALYGLGDIFVTFDASSAEAIEQGRHFRDVVTKQGGQAISVTPFLQDTHAHIAAVLSSRWDAANIRGRLGDDFLLLPNACAANPLPRSLIRLGEELVLTPAAEGEWDVLVVDHRASSTPGSLPP